jgi:Type I restriction enzyme R protein N terminus (HSDR_N)
MFGQHPFERYSENDVRENIIRPLLSKLGYSAEMVMTQVALKYHWQFLGRKKGPAKDRPLRGEADYIMDVDCRLRWVIEAKKPGEITEDDREQAYSYAMHPEIRAVLFAVISGTHFEIYQTVHKPGAGPLLAFTYEQLPAVFQSLANIVAPDALRRDHPTLTIDVGRPLAPGLRSFAKVAKGKITYTESTPFIESVVGMTVHLTEGSVVRAEGGGIMILIKPSFHHATITQFSEAIDATEVELITTDETISTDQARPTIFTQVREIAIDEGTPVPNFASFATVPAAVSVRSAAAVAVSGFVVGTKFVGSLVVRSFVPTANITVQICADIELYLQ